MIALEIMTIRLFELVCYMNARIHVVSLNAPKNWLGKKNLLRTDVLFSLPPN